jgi:hypothetical protein
MDLCHTGHWRTERNGGEMVKEAVQALIPSTEYHHRQEQSGMFRTRALISGNWLTVTNIEFRQFECTLVGSESSLRLHH